MDLLENLKRALPEIEIKISYTFNNKDLLVLALIHRSFANETKRQMISHNERLEFLGDAVLNLIVADYLYQKLPSSHEGSLSQLRSRLVDAASCAFYLQKMGLGRYILLGRGERMGEGAFKTSILADAFEALIGALYLDGGIDVVRGFFISQFEKEVEIVMGTPSRNYKAELQDYSQRCFGVPPVYKVVDEVGPDHAKVFHVIVFLDGKQAGIAMGASKKEAEQMAASQALKGCCVEQNKGSLEL